LTGASNLERTMQYKVVPMQQLLEWPSNWQLSPQYEEEFSQALAMALQQESASGWELVTLFAVPNHSGPGYAVFRAAGKSPPPLAN
jgi:hypothetical protein